MSDRRVLVIRGGAIGDFILTLPAIRLIRESIADVHIEVMGNHGIVELALASGHADAIRHLDSPGMARMFAPNATLDVALTDWLKGFNIVVSYLFDPDVFFRGNMERAGVRTFLDAPHRVQEGGAHAQFQLAAPLQRLAMWLEPDAAPVIRIPNAESPRNGCMVVIHPGSGSIKKNWPVEHWARLGLDLLKDTTDVRLVLLTGEAERERGVTETLKSAWKDLPVDHWDSLPLPELARRLPAGSHFLGHDSGMTHLATACGLRCHAFFGHTDPAVWAPKNPGMTWTRSPDHDLSQLSYAAGRKAVWRFLELQ